MNDAVIEAVGLVKTYGATDAVRDVSFTVSRSTTFGLLGPNGAGKTTIIKMLTGLARATAGSIRFFGIDFAKRPIAIKRRIGHVYAGMAFYPELNGPENLRFFGRFYGLGRRDLNARIERTLRFVELWDERRKPVGAYSNGMRQRLGIAKALVHDPDVLLFDEATNGVDVEGTSDLRELMFDLRVQGKTAVVTSHRLDEIELLCDEIAILDKGRIVERGSPDDIRDGLRDVLFKFVVHRPDPIQGDWEHPAATVRYTRNANVVVSDKDVSDELRARFGDDAVERVEPTFEEACVWILRHEKGRPDAPG